MKKILMPESLTAENGAKKAFIGEFSESIDVTCHECGGDGEDGFGENCWPCGGLGTWEQEVTVSWTTIKDIYAKAVEMFKEE